MAEKHHYFPIFYQKRWASDRDGRVCVFHKPYQEVKALRRHPDRIGFKYDLYTIQNVDGETANRLERRFFLRVDNDAAQAISVMERDVLINLDSRLRSGWSRFVMSLIHRSPEEVLAFSREIKRHLERAMHEFRECVDPPTFERLFRNRTRNPTGMALALLIQKVIDSQMVGNHLNGMEWTIISPPSSYTFLTSDRPIVMTNGLSNDNSHLVIPIGPRKLFVACNTTATAREIASLKPNDLVARVNDRVVRQARDFVIGIDDGQLRFVEKRFGDRLPSSPTETAPRLSYEELFILDEVP